MLKALAAHNIHLHIISAGVLGIITQSIDLLRELEGIEELKNIVYIGTQEEYDKDEILVAFKEPIITSLNKSKLISHEILPHVPLNSNAIVIGDLIPDLLVTENLKLDTVLSVGFYHEEGSSPLENFKEQYDVLILNDGNLTWVANLIKGLNFN